MGKYWPVIAFVLAVIFAGATQRWMGFEQGSQFVVATSSPLYVEIARAAPVYPTAVPYYVAERVLPHFGVGVIAKWLGVSVDSAYAGVTIALIVLIMVVLYFGLAGLRIPASLRALLLASVLLNPYTFRYYLLAKPMFTDLIFVLGLALIVLGLFRTSLIVVIVGLLIAVFGRSMVMMILPGTLLGVWAFFEPKRRFVKLVFVLAISMIAVKIMVSHALTLGKPLWSEAGLLFSMASWVHSPDFSLAILAQHFLRSFLPILIPLALLFGTTALTGTGKNFKTLKVLAMLLLVTGLLMGALLPNPAIQQNSQGRYSAYAIVVMTLLVGWLWSGYSFHGSGQKSVLIGLWIILAGALGAASLHHMYTIIGPANVADFGMFHVASCEMLAIVSWTLFRRSAPKVLRESKIDFRSDQV